jgi:UDP-N-acetylglucosamine:LPS N-acetylglucosamine transferase
MSDNEPRIRVLYCILDSRFGGPHRLAQTTARQLRDYGVETCFLLGRKSQDVWQPNGFEVFACRRIQCFTRRHPLWNFLAFCCFLPGNLLRICRLIRSHDIDIVHVDGITNFVPALAAGLTRTPVVWHYNDHLPDPLRRLLLYQVKALASTVRRGPGPIQSSAARPSCSIPGSICGSSTRTGTTARPARACGRSWACRGTSRWSP